MTTSCAEVSDTLGEPLAGTASQARGFLLLEHGDAWDRTPLQSPSLPSGVGPAVESACEAADLKPLLGRRPGGERHVENPMVIVAVPDHGGLTLVRRLTTTRDVVDLDLPAVATAARSGVVPSGWKTSPPVLAVCTHGRRDACCARLGRPVAAALAALAPRQVWECSHLGGHRLAGNVLALPTGLLYGRVGPEQAPALLAAVTEGRVLPDLLRGRSHLAAPLQVAEVALRRAARAGDERGARLLASDTADLVGATGARTTSVWQVGTASWRVVVDATPGSTARPVSCGAAAEPPPDVHTVVEVADASGPGRGARGWDERYRQADGPTEPHPAVVETAQALTPGRALDIACGTGRHSLWLASRGWDVTALDFSRAGVDTLARTAAERGLEVHTVLGDARVWAPPTGTTYDLVLMTFVHLPEMLARAASWVAPRGGMVVVGHSTRTPEGTGPDDPRLRLDRADLAARVTGARLRVQRAAEVDRETPGGTTTDVVVVAHRPV